MSKILEKMTEETRNSDKTSLVSLTQNSRVDFNNTCLLTPITQLLFGKPPTYNYSLDGKNLIIHFRFKSIN